MKSDPKLSLKSLVCLACKQRAFAHSAFSVSQRSPGTGGLSGGESGRHGFSAGVALFALSRTESSCAGEREASPGRGLGESESASGDFHRDLLAVVFEAQEKCASLDGAPAFVAAFTSVYFQEFESLILLVRNALVDAEKLQLERQRSKALKKGGRAAAAFEARWSNLLLSK